MNDLDKIMREIPCNTITTLIYCNKNLGDGGAKKIAEALVKSRSITTLDLNGNDIKPAGAKFLAETLTINKSITTLCLDKNKIGHDGAKFIAKAIKTNQFITAFHLDSNELGDLGAKCIAEALKYNQTIASFHLSGNQIKAAGAKDIAEALKVNQSITAFYLDVNDVGDAGAKDIAEALKINKSITTLDLRKNQIGSAGASHLAKALTINKSITTLNLAENKVGCAGAVDIGEALKNNKSVTIIDLSDNGIQTHGARGIIGGLKINHSITTLNLARNVISHIEAENILEALKVNETITNLDLSGNQIGDIGARDIAEALKINKSITTINLASNKIGEAGAKAIAEALEKNESINVLDMNSNEIKCDGAKDIAEALRKNQSVIDLKLACNGIQRAGAIHIAEALKINESVTSLDLSNNTISDGGKNIAEALKINKSITSLYLQGNQMGVAGMKDIAEALKINKTITTLDLSNNCRESSNSYVSVGNDIAEAIKINETITTLILSKNQLTSKGIKAITEALKINESITTFGFSGIGSSSYIEDLCDVMEFNYTITSLDIDCSTSYKKSSVDEAVKKNKTRVRKIKQIELNDRMAEQKKCQQQDAKCKPLEGNNINQYQPNTFCANIFEKMDSGHLFENDDQVTIRRISDLIQKGNERLQDHAEKGILLLGNTGAGKSSLAHVLSGRKLKALIDDDTGDLVIDALQPHKDIIIGHAASETRIPNKCFREDVTIWDCPGFYDTDHVQEIVNTFYINRVFEITDKLKFVLVVPALTLNTAYKRGKDFIEAVSNLIKLFKDVECVKKSASLVVTHVAPNKTIFCITKLINKILKDNPESTDEQTLVNHLKDNGSIHLFYKPSGKGEIVIPDLFAKIDANSEYSAVHGEMVNKAISKKAMDCSLHLLKIAGSNLNQLLEVIAKSISYATQCTNFNPQNAFSENYSLVKDWVSPSIRYTDLPYHDKDEHFSELDLLVKLQGGLQCDQVVLISDAIAMFRNAVETFAEYAESENSDLQHKIQIYGHCLQQQYEYVTFFASVCKAELPDHTKINDLLKLCHSNVTDNLQHQVSSLTIVENQSNPDYYNKAIKYLNMYPDSSACKKLKALAYSCLANIAEENDDQELLLVYCTKAIEANRQLAKIYKILGRLFFNKSEYAKAIDCYKVVNNVLHIKECFKKMVKQNPNSPGIMLQQAEYFESIGLFEHAKKYYHLAFSLSEDEDFNLAVLEKIGNIMVNNNSQGKDFITRAKERNCYNFSLVNEVFIKKLLKVE